MRIMLLQFQTSLNAKVSPYLWNTWVFLWALILNRSLHGNLYCQQSGVICNPGMVRCYLLWEECAWLKVFYHFFLYHKVIVKQLTLLQARFLYVGVIDRRHMHRLAWYLFINEKDKGGLRVISIIVKKYKLVV